MKIMNTNLVISSTFVVLQSVEGQPDRKEDYRRVTLVTDDGLELINRSFPAAWFDEGRLTFVGHRPTFGMPPYMEVKMDGVHLCRVALPVVY